MRASIVLGLTLLLAAPSVAGARSRVAILKFGGPRAAPAQRVVTKVLKKRYKVMGPAAWKRLARRARARGMSPRAVKKAARKGRVKALVTGRIRGRGRRARLMVTVRSGATGRVVETVTIKLRRGRLAGRGVRDLRRQLTQAVAAAVSGEAPEAPEPPAAEPPPTEPPPEQPAAAAPPPPYKPSGEIDQPIGGEATGTATKKPKPEEPDEPIKPSDRGIFFAAGAGMSFWARRMSVSPGESSDTYKGRPVPGLHIEGEVYPLATTSRGFLGDLGVGVLLDMVWLSSELQAGGTKLATTQTRWGLDLRWRLALGKTATAPVLKASLGVSQLKFSIGDRDSAPPDLDIPDVSYLSFGPTVGIVVPLGTPRFRAGTSFAYLITSASGAPRNTSNSGSWGIDFGLHLDYLPWPWLLTRAQFGVVRYSNSFTPTAPATTTSSADLYIGGLLSVGVLY